MVHPIKKHQFINFKLRSMMQDTWTYNRDFCDFMENAKRIIKFPEDVVC